MKESRRNVKEEDSVSKEGVGVYGSTTTSDVVFEKIVSWILKGERKIRLKPD